MEVDARKAIAVKLSHDPVQLKRPQAQAPAGSDVSAKLADHMNSSRETTGGSFHGPNAQHHMRKFHISTGRSHHLRNLLEYILLRNSSSEKASTRGFAMSKVEPFLPLSIAGAANAEKGSSSARGNIEDDEDAFPQQESMEQRNTSQPLNLYAFLSEASNPFIIPPIPSSISLSTTLKETFERASNSIKTQESPLDLCFDVSTRVERNFVLRNNLSTAVRVALIMIVSTFTVNVDDHDDVNSLMFKTVLTDESAIRLLFRHEAADGDEVQREQLEHLRHFG